MNGPCCHAALIVDGLSLSTTEEDLKQKFEPFGEVVWTQVMMRYGRSLGYGYVVMANKTDAETAIDALNGQSLTIALTVIPPLPRV